MDRDIRKFNALGVVKYGLEVEHRHLADDIVGYNARNHYDYDNKENSVYFDVSQVI